MSPAPNIQTEWFDPHGYVQREFPSDCVHDCSHYGSCDADVKYWRERLEFRVPRERATAYIREFGAWTTLELATKTDEELAEVVLWLACCDIRETGGWVGLMI